MMNDTSRDSHTSTTQRTLSGKMISVTGPAYNEVESLRELCERLVKTLSPLSDQFEIVIVDNGSSDGSLEVLRELGGRDKRIKYVSLSRNFGHQGGLIAGMAHTSGDIIITMDADLQHPPEVLPELLSRWRDGFDVVGTRKRTTPYTSLLRRIINSVFYKVIGAMTRIPLDRHQSDFRLLDRKALDALMDLPEQDKFLRGLTYWIGFKQASVEYDPVERKSGRTKFNAIALIRFAIHGVVSFTAFPLRVFTVLGSAVAILSLLNAAYLIADWLLSDTGAVPEGWRTLATGIYFLGGMTLIGVGVLGEYLAQTLSETRHRPSFIVAESTAEGLRSKVAQSR